VNDYWLNETISCSRGYPRGVVSAENECEDGLTNGWYSIMRWNRSGIVARRAGIETWPIPVDCERSSRAEIRECDVCTVARTRDLEEICLLSSVEANNDGDLGVSAQTVRWTICHRLKLSEICECVDCTVAMTTNLSSVELLKSRLRDWYVCWAVRDWNWKEFLYQHYRGPWKVPVAVQCAALRDQVWFLTSWELDTVVCFLSEI